MEQLPLVEESTPTQEPIRDVGTFWERLDEVLNLIKTGGTQMDRVEEILKEFPEQVGLAREYNSFLFQPERLAISSNQDISPSTQVSNFITQFVSNSGHIPAESYRGFRVTLRRGLVNVKSLQLLSAIIPQAFTNFPDDEVVFFYYKLRKIADAHLGEWDPETTYNLGDIVHNGDPNPGTREYFVSIQQSLGIDPALDENAEDYWQEIPNPLANDQRPNYYDLNWYRLQVVTLVPTYFTTPDFFGPALYSTWNRTFQDYPDLVASLQASTQSVTTASIPNDVTFLYDPTLNKIQMVGNDGDAFYMPAGYEDPNINIAWANYTDVPAYPNFWNNPGIMGLSKYAEGIFYSPDKQNTLNKRLGYTWNGLFTNPLSIDPFSNPGQNILVKQLYYYLRPFDPATTPLGSTRNTFNSYPNLVYTSAIRVYCDAIGASTQEPTGVESGGLLSVIPADTNTLGVAYYQNNFNNPLTRIPKIITELGFRFETDAGMPVNLPNSATVILELAVDYY